MNRYDIRAEIQKKGATLTKVALDAGLSESACRMALMYENSPAGDQAIAKFLGKSLHTLWPSRYDKNNTRIVGRGHCQKHKAA